MTEDDWLEWPNCAIDACPNKCCRRLDSKYCWPHTPGVDPEEVRESLRAMSEHEEVEDLSDHTKF